MSARIPKASLVKKWITSYPKGVYKVENAIVFCNLCNQQVGFALSTVYSVLYLFIYFRYNVPIQPNWSNMTAALCTKEISNVFSAKKSSINNYFFKKLSTSQRWTNSRKTYAVHWCQLTFRYKKWITEVFKIFLKSIAKEKYQVGLHCRIRMLTCAMKT